MGKGSKKREGIVPGDSADRETSEGVKARCGTSPSPEEITRRRQNSAYYLAVSVSLITFLIYLPSLRNTFLGWDDSDYILNNPHIRSFNLDLFRWAFFDFYASNWHPLTWISHALDYAVWGLNPMGHHLTNNILHAVNTFLVVVLVTRLLTYRQASVHADKLISSHDSRLKTVDNSRLISHDSQFTLIAAGVTGVLFGIHPLHVESVAWVSERKDLLCALFYLLSIMAYARYAANIPQRAKRIEHRANNIYFAFTQRAMLFALCFFILALLSKPMAVSLPVVLLILDWYPYGRIASLRTLREAVIEKVPFLVLSIGSSVLTIYAQKAGAAMHLMGAVPLQARLLVAAKSLVAYLGKIFFPFNLIPFYPYPRDASFFSPAYFAAFLLIIGITVLCSSSAKKQKIWLAFWGYYVVTLIPVLGIVQVGSQSMADRYTYLPSCGPFIMIGIAVSWALTRTTAPGTSLRRFTAVSLAAALLVFSSMSYMTVKQTGIWKNDLTLWNYVVRKERKGAPPTYHKDVIYLNLGAALLDNGQIDEAIESLRIALEMNPFRLQTYINMGLALGRNGRLDEAIEYFRYALAIMPTDAEAHNNLGWAYREKGMLDEAIAQFETAVQLRPDYTGARSSLEEAYREKASRVGP